ncbi:MAG TPA: hypothetical protein VIW73_06930 [Candidatus Cybelea sp.]
MLKSCTVYTTAAIALGAVSLVLAACSRPQSGGFSFAPEAAAYRASGDTATPLSLSLGSQARIVVAKDPYAELRAPNRAWRMLPGVLRVRFATPPHETNVAGPGLRLTLRYPAGQARLIAAGHASLIEIGYATGRKIRFVSLDRVDAANRNVTTELPAMLLDGALYVAMGIGVDNEHYRSQPPGPRYWDGKAWSKDGKILAGKTTLVLIHGIFSSVEESFPATPSPCPQQIANAGGYEQILGWDYDWFNPPSVEGPLFQKFLDTVAKTGVKSLDVEAHSYGTLVTLAALPRLPRTSRPSHVVLLGGPLPLRGTPLAKKENGWRMGFVLGVLDTFSDQPPGNVDKAIDSGMIASLAPNSTELTSILIGIHHMRPRPTFIEAAGTEWMCLVHVYGVCVLNEDYFKKVLVEGSGVTLPWDGVVETLAAKSDDIPFPVVAKTFPVSHIELECSDKVVDWVGQQVKP